MKKKISATLIFVLVLLSMPTTTFAATVFNDTFTSGTDVALENHTPDTGTSWTVLWQTDTDSELKDIASTGRATASTTLANSGFIYKANGTPTSNDYVVTVTASAGCTGSNRCYVFARMTDQNNLYALRYTTGASVTRMYKEVAGVWTALGSFIADPAVGDVLKFKVVGNKLQYYYNGVLKDTQTDTSITAIGNAGLGMGGGTQLAASTDDILSTSAFDNFSVTDAPVEVETSGHGTTGGAAATSFTITVPTLASSSEFLVGTFSLRQSAAEVVNSITGCNGYTWTKASVSTNANLGLSEEVWYTMATSTTFATACTINLSGSIKAAGEIVAFSDTDKTGSNGSGAVGATSTNNGTSQNPNVTLTTTRDGSLVIAGLGARGAATYTPPAGQRITSSDTTTGGAGGSNATSTSLASTTVTTLSGTSIQMGTTTGNNLSSSIDWSIGEMEIKAPAVAVVSATVLPRPRAIVTNGKMFVLSGKVVVL